VSRERRKNIVKKTKREKEKILRLGRILFFTHYAISFWGEIFAVLNRTAYEKTNISILDSFSIFFFIFSMTVSDEKS